MACLGKNIPGLDDLDWANLALDSIYGSIPRDREEAPRAPRTGPTVEFYDIPYSPQILARRFAEIAQSVLCELRAARNRYVGH